MKRSPLRYQPRPIPKPVRDAMLERDGYCCVWCGNSSDYYRHTLTIQHRYGGKGRPETLDALVTMCLFENTRIEQDADFRSEAEDRGFRLRRWQAASTPVIDWAGQAWLLAADGSRSFAEVCRPTQERRSK